VSCAAGAGTEREAVHLAIARTWRWHHLLRGGSDSRLTLEEQKGLIGELLVLERHLLPNLAPADAVSAWHGPLDSPKDFEVGHICIEVKTRRGAATPHVVISSENQLDGSGIDLLFLYVIDLDWAPGGAANSFSLADIAARVRQAIMASDDAAAVLFDELLAAAGFRRTDDYSDSLWVEGGHRVCRVIDGFPRITADQIASGVSDVKYSLSLVSCQPFLVEMAHFDAVIRGGSHAL